MSIKKEIKVTNLSNKDIQNVLDFVKDVIKSYLWEVTYNRVYGYSDMQEYYDRIIIKYNDTIICYLWKDVVLTRETLFEFLKEAKIIKIKCQLKKK